MNELRQALELATEEELQDLTDLLFRRKYNPLDYLREPTPGQVQATNRQEWLAAIENRFRFVAADGFTVLKGQTETLNYRQVLVQVSRHLKIQYSPTLSTTDLEAEIYLHLIKEAWQKLPENQQEQLRKRIQTALAEAPGTPLPVNCQTDPRRWLLEGSSALAVSSVLRPLLLKQLARQFAAQMAVYQVARQAAPQIEGQLAVQAARRGMAWNAARYGVMRGALTVVSSALWVGLFADLGWRAIATNYGRVIPVIFTLAQIRLIRGETSWQSV
ncbi:YaaW family protein [Acaryochloris marina NIES-2412]|uniref:YaaW family protein n=1 Tax=Acaryochloris marina TaxID=155978 RepID=UPI004058C870